ncbi:MAG: SGNH/GDSL hydrolase family protein [Planctomycetes bacterium]|nr:SGNH/GDSL hydrolase family protein [Planctomycetota bacterium]
MAKTETFQRADRTGSGASGRMSVEAGSRRRAAFRVLAVVFGLAPFVIVEVALRVLDVARPTAYVDPFVGFSDVHPLFELDQNAGVWRTAPSRRLHFCVQEFAAEKPADTLRVFCLGGSTVYGRPFMAQTAFPRWLELELAGTDLSHRYEVINCGGISYASYRLVPILQEVLHYDPDLIVVATGHNEFLEDRTYGEIKRRSAMRRWLEERLYSLRIVTVARRLAHAAALNSGGPTQPILPDEVEARLDDQSGYASYHWDPEWRRRVIAHYRESLTGMTRLCAAAGVPLLFVNLGSNLRDCPPFKSELNPQIRPERENRWQALFDEAAEVEPKDPRRAIELYRQAKQIDDHFALLEYRIAGCLDRLGRYAEARDYYVLAKEKDVCPLRMLEPMHEALFEVAAETGTPVVDARRLLAELSADELPGYDWYVDHVHPNVSGHQRIAQAIARTLRGIGWMSGGQWSDAERQAAYRLHLESLGPSYWADGRKRITWVESWSRRNRSAGDLTPRNARAYANRARRWMELGQTEPAWQDCREAIQRDPAMRQAIVDHVRELEREGRPHLAEQLLQRLRQETERAESAERGGADRLSD